MSCTGAEPSKTCIDELSHLIYLEYVLFCDLTTDIVIFFAILQKTLFSMIEHLKKGTLKPSFDSKLC